jgi:hypothetical protein
MPELPIGAVSSAYGIGGSTFRSRTVWGCRVGLARAEGGPKPGQ